MNRNDFYGYLFVHFIGEEKEGEQIYFSISRDGLHWDDLNNGNLILKSSVGEMGVRDPFMIRSEDGKKYYIIATDLCIANGKGWGVAQYEGSRSLIVWESEDLIHWSKERKIEVGIEGAGCVWAPEAIYDKKHSDYLVFWASMVKEDGDKEAKQRIYYAKTKDFHTFTKAQKYIERENHIIDTTIICDKDTYYRISKDETTKNIKIDCCQDLIEGPFIPVSAPELEGIVGVEGPAAFPFHGCDKWCLMVDQFATNGGYLPLVTEDFKTGKFHILDSSEYDMGKNIKRHGSVLNLTKQEYDALIDRYREHNPIIKGLYADPDLLQVGDTFYLYPTTDGFSGWSGTKFHVFSSKDLYSWKDEGVILDVASDDVKWSVGSAWAPAISCKNGKYYYYFCAKRPDQVSCIGVAVSDHPAGPFKAMPEPLITPEMVKAEQVQISQAIDPSVFIEDDGQAYLFFGNGHAAVVALNEDMVSCKPGTIRQIEGAYDFRESIVVTKRNGIYHFTWSCDDTGSENYHINYGTSNHLLGPITYHYPVLEKDLEKDILGTGHHTILKLQDQEEYYMVYHRFGTPLELYPEEKGCHREVCINKLYFDENGMMKPVTVTK